jgi:hypothetical protein
MMEIRKHKARTVLVCLSGWRRRAASVTAAARSRHNLSSVKSTAQIQRAPKRDHQRIGIFS